MMNKTFTYLSILFIGLVLASCTKEEDLAPLPQDKILEYRVDNVPTGTSLYGAIDQNEGTITLYVPFYLGLELIDADIKVSPGAKLQEAIQPIPVDTKGQTYTVIAADGTTNTYKLQIVPQNTPQLEVVWGIYNYPATQPSAYPLQVLPTIYGNFYSNNIALVDVRLTSRRTGKEVQLNTRAEKAALSPVTGENYKYSLSSIPIPKDVDTGYNDVQIDFLGHRATLADPVNIQYRAPRINYAAGTAAQQSGEVVFKATPQYLILDPTSVKATDTETGKVYDLSIVKYDMESITLKIPDDFPVGMPTSILIFETMYKDWPATSERTYMNVSPK
jgi:hypothetical protein